MGDATFTVQRTTSVDAPPGRVYDAVVDLHRWTAWSPWEDLDPDLQRTYSGKDSGVGAAYAWSGNRRAGQGRMEVVEAVEPSLVRVDVSFVKPFRSQNDTVFRIDPEGEGSKVTWTMTGPRTLVTRVMGLVRSMDAMIGPDFEKGLARLKRVAETTP